VPSYVTTYDGDIGLPASDANSAWKVVGGLGGTKPSSDIVVAGITSASHVAWNGNYQLQSGTYNNRLHFKHATATAYIFFSSYGGAVRLGYWRQLRPIR
jgi:hypothetical protein